MHDMFVIIQYIQVKISFCPLQSSNVVTPPKKNPTHKKTTVERRTHIFNSTNAIPLLFRLFNQMTRRQSYLCIGRLPRRPASSRNGLWAVFASFLVSHLFTAWSRVSISRRLRNRTGNMRIYLGYRPIRPSSKVVQHWRLISQHVLSSPFST